MLKTVLDFLLVAVGFGLIIFVHELGHFLAARWAGIRVLAFAIGFGPALVSYRKGLGLRRGSSEREYMEKHPRDASISATEYRLNSLPFGGYVKMLGQDDMDATARSTEADSYQSCHPWKRLVVISAGVVMNLITAAALFVFVFMVGRQVMPPVVGGVARNSPAALAQPVAPITNVHPGLKAGDRVLRINGKSLRSFDDLTLSIAMAPKDEPLEFVVDRGGEELTFSAVPRRELTTGLLAVGLQPAFGLTLPKLDDAADAGALASFLKGEGVQGLGAGDRVSLVDGRAAVYAHDIDAAIAAGRGEAVTVTVARADGTTSTATIEPRAEFENDLVASDAKSVIPVRHILGLTGVLRVLDADPEGAGPKASEQGLKDGDVFAVLGGVEYPSIAEGIMQIREHQGKSIDAVVIRQVESAGGEVQWVEVPLPGLKVSRDGRLGFARGDTGDVSALLAAPIGTVRRNFDKDVRTAAAASGLTAGTTVLEVDALPTPTLEALRDALRLATRKAMDEKQGATVTLRVRRPVAGVPDASAPIEDIRWELTKEDVAAVHSLGWTNGLAEAGVLQPAEVALKADNPLAAVKMGVAETKRVMLMTYLTFARLAQGSVKVEHLKGPVGIAHLGTLVADKGLIWLLFFLALISVNLAVINFLPLPIVDGGQALFIIYEWVRGKPVPVGFQNAVTMAGLVMIGVMFLLVTYNDIRGLFGL